MNQAGTVLIVGADGMIGRTLADRFAAAGRNVVRTTLLPTAGAVTLDLAREAAAWTPPPAAVAFLCGAITSQEQCRSRRAESRAVNVEGTVALAERLVRQGTHVVFPSTNLVLDGLGAPPIAPCALRPANRIRTAEGRDRSPSAAIAGHVRGAVHQGLGAGCAAVPGLDRGPSPGRGHPPFFRHAHGPRAAGLCRRGPRCRRRAAAWKASSRYRPKRTSPMRRRHASWPIRLGCPPELIQPVTVAESGAAIEYVPAHTTLDTTRLECEFGLVAASPLDGDCPGNGTVSNLQSPAPAPCHS